MTIGVSPRGLTREASERADRAVREASPWIEGLGRFGYLSIGLVYATIGLLAGLAALGQGGDTTDSHGALTWLLQAPYGRGVLGALAVGIAGYALWRLVQAIRDTESNGSDWKGIGNRLVYVFIAVTYSGLALSAFRLAQSQGERGGGAGDATAQDWTAWLLGQPFGQVLVAAVGLAVIGVGAVQFYLAFTDRCCNSIQMSRLGRTQQELVRWAGRAGYSARGMALGIIGVLLIVAALRSRPDEARGLGGALATLAHQPFGPWLLGAAAAGLVAYGAFMMIQSRYRRFVVR